VAAPADPSPPYVAVIFSSRRRPDEGTAYGEAAERMEQLARGQDGFLGIESARGTDGVGLTVSYWRDEGAARAWKQVAEHLEAQRRGREEWYEEYVVRVATVTRAYGSGRPAG